MADNFKFNVDGRELQAKPGTLLIDACRAAGIEVPAFCYYPGLSLQAACRMCLVEIEKTPKLQTACTTPVAEGMIVRTSTPIVVDARRAMLELLLANHPLDCPVCDKGGECELQDMVFRYGAAESRFREEKRHVDEQQWSPVVYYDAPRCILCYRCVRVCGEGMDVWALGVVNRGARSEIAPNHGDHLDCEECGMCIDICPVGALTSGAYRYRARPWEIKYVSTICTHCGDGCKTTLSVRNGKILRGNNRDHSGINGEFLCIKGRYGYDFIENPNRIRTPLIRKDGKLVEASWEQAIQTIAAKWKEILHRRETGTQEAQAFGVIGSNHTTNEENYILQKFARTVLKTNNIDHHRTVDYAALIRAIANAIAKPVGDSAARPASDFLARSKDLSIASAVLVIGGNPTDQHPLLAWNIREGCRLNGTRLYVINSRRIPLARKTFRFLPIAEGGEQNALEFLRGERDAEKRLQGATPGGREVTAEFLNDFRDKLGQEKDLIVLFEAALSGECVAQLVEWGSRLPGRTRFIAQGDYSNSRGAADMGLLPNALPGYASVEDNDARLRFENAWSTTVPAEPGMPLHDMLAAAAQGKLESLYVIGANPLKGWDTAASLGGCFVVVQDLFLTETALVADVVLPAASAYEKSGTVTNTCGELQKLSKGMEVMGTRADLDIFSRLAGALGVTQAPLKSEEVLEEIRKLVSGYGVPLVNIVAGGAELVAPLDGFQPVSATHTANVKSSRDTLFTSGTLGRYSSSLQAVPERTTRTEPDPA
ncbi:MAG: NADH-quinone oxidoreductase subunit NuoG [Acidobacteria bacterium]|nr:NADH-quinone oxidoreductase subunit NuoG [Acidobacteriota bacterium]